MDSVPAELQLVELGIVPAGGIPFPGMKFLAAFRIIFDIVQQMQHINMIMMNGNNINAGWKSISSSLKPSKVCEFSKFDFKRSKLI